MRINYCIFSILAMTFTSASAWGAAGRSGARVPADSLSLVPLPRHIAVYRKRWTVPATVHILADQKSQQPAASFLAAFLKRHGIRVHMIRTGRAQIRFSHLTAARRLGREGYRLRVASRGAVLRASAGAGYFYAVQTFEQLFDTANPADRKIHEVRIEDRPRYRWRGIMLDCSRHFFPPQVVMKFIRLAAHYKLNVFHWHLTDDQGWRIEIPQYARLTSVGAWRAGTEMHGIKTDIKQQRYGGFYTDAQIRRIVAYAARRYVTVVPEIDIPGHCTAALAAYPWLAAGKGPFQVRETWGISNVPLSPVPRTFQFLDTVFDDLTHLFPGRFIHLGGDEVSAAAMRLWSQNPFAARLMRQHHWSPERLHDYFPTKLARFLADSGRRAVVWNDVPAANLPRNTVIECWNSTSIAAKDARLGHDVIVADMNRLYFNFCQGDPKYEPHAIEPVITLREVYHFNPSALLPRSLRRRLLGAEACLWSERIATARHLFYQALPREMALAEICWTPRAGQNYRHFLLRTAGQYAWLTHNHYPFRIPPPTATVTAPGGGTVIREPTRNLVIHKIASARATITLYEPVPGAIIRFRFHRHAGAALWHRYRHPIPIVLKSGKPFKLRSMAFLAADRSSAPATVQVERTQ